MLHFETACSCGRHQEGQEGAAQLEQQVCKRPRDVLFNQDDLHRQATERRAKRCDPLAHAHARTRSARAAAALRAPSALLLLLFAPAAVARLRARLRWCGAAGAGSGPGEGSGSGSGSGEGSGSGSGEGLGPHAPADRRGFGQVRAG